MEKKRIILLIQNGDIIDKNVLEGFEIGDIAFYKEDFDYSSNDTKKWKERRGCESFELYGYLKKQYEKGLKALEERKATALAKFKKDYPSTVMGDLQAFVLGMNAMD